MSIASYSDVRQIAKRKELRRVLGVRGSLEVQRHERLQRLLKVCSSYSQYSKSEWELARERLLSPSYGDYDQVGSGGAIWSMSIPGIRLLRKRPPF